MRDTGPPLVGNVATFTYTNVDATGPNIQVLASGVRSGRQATPASS